MRTSASHTSSVVPVEHLPETTSFQTSVATYLGKRFDVFLKDMVANSYKKKYHLEFRNREALLAEYRTGKPLVLAVNHVGFDDAKALISALPFDTSVAMSYDQYREMTDPNIGLKKFPQRVIMSAAKARAAKPQECLGSIADLIHEIVLGIREILDGALSGYRNRFIFDRVRVVPINFRKPEGIRKLTEFCRNGYPTVIFPEGMLTHSGSLMPISEGALSIAKAAGADIVPIHLTNFEYLPSSHTELRKRGYPVIETKAKDQPKLSITALKSCKIELPEGLSGRAQRLHLAQQVGTMLLEAATAGRTKHTTIFDAVREAALLHGMDKIIVEDLASYMLDDADVASGKLRENYTYRTLIRDSIVIANKVASFTEFGEHVGMMIANSKSAAAAVLGIQSRGRVPTMLNPKMDLATMQGCIKTANIKTIFTARKVIAKLGLLEDKNGEPRYMDQLAKTVTDERSGLKLRIIYAEDMRKEMRINDIWDATCSAFGDPYRPFDERVQPDNEALIFFTSGSEGLPKAVVLRHSNILANVAQVTSGGYLLPHDVLFNTLPLFHSYGMNMGMLYPLLSGVRSFQFADPTNAKAVVSAVNVSAATVITVTNTFAGMYLESAPRGELRLLRGIVVGGEALKSDVISKAQARAPHAVIYHGWGTTEASPVLTVTNAGDPLNTVGRFLPTIEHRLEPVDGYPTIDGHEVGICHVRGPNLMQGYMKPENPGVIEPLGNNGWYNTGDVVAVNRQTGLVQIIGRARRIAKIGGEMVPLAGLEQDIANMTDLLPEKGPTPEYAVVCIETTEGKAKLVLYTNNKLASNNERGFLKDVAKRLREVGKDGVFLPKEVVYLPSLPKLAIGKMDIKTLERGYPEFSQRN